MKVFKINSKVATVVRDGVLIPIVKSTTAEFGGIKKTGDDYSVIFKCRSQSSIWYGFSSLEEAVDKYMFLYNLCIERDLKSLEPIHYEYGKKE